MKTTLRKMLKGKAHLFAQLHKKVQIQSFHKKFPFDHLLRQYNNKKITSKNGKKIQIAKRQGY